MKSVSSKITLMAMMAVIFITSIGCQQTPPPQSEPIVSDPGVVSWSLRNQFAEDVPGTLDMLKEIGITKIEFSSLFGLTAAELRELLDERGMYAISYGVSYVGIQNDLTQIASDASTLGAKFVRVANIPRDGMFTLEMAREAVQHFNNAGRYLLNYDIRFAYHNHGFEFVPHGDGTLFDYMVQNTNPEYVSFEMDVMWVVHPGHDPVELLQRYPDRFRLMHLRDLKKGVVGDLSGGTPIENDVILGTGQVDFPSVLRASMDTNIEYFFIEDGHPDVVSRLPQSRAYILSITAD
ncbi:MAG: sugar phosphate isomerase/epimerase [Balneolales bacterium]|nr:sugar phosphate isomerase/epimerase [Balneolales bacterium]